MIRRLSSVPPRWAVRLAAGYLAAVLLVWVALAGWGDAAAWPTLLLFGPRWVVGLPLLVLLPLAAAARSRPAGGLAVAAAAVVAGPVTGGTVAVTPHVRAEGTVLFRLRVVTWNMGGAKPVSSFRRFLGETRPDVVLMQEADRSLSAADLPDGWNLVGLGGAMPVASRLPVREDGALPAAELGAPGGVRRDRVDTGFGEVAVVNVHLPTVRPGIEAALGSRFRNLGPLADAVAVRARAARAARAWAGDPSPGLIVAGDFNTPPQGRIYADTWAAFGNAYSDAGVGWGKTKWTRWSGTRIDHVLYGPGWRCRAAWVGPDLGSDHRPLVADLDSVDLP